MNKQYLYIEPYTLFFEKDKKVLLYNTMDQKFTLIEVDGSLSHIVKKLKEQKCIEILPSQLENKSINRFVEELRACFNGDILSGSANEVAPAVFHPARKERHPIKEPVHPGLSFLPAQFPQA